MIFNKIKKALVTSSLTLCVLFTSIPVYAEEINSDENPIEVQSLEEQPTEAVINTEQVVESTEPSEITESTSEEQSTKSEEVTQLESSSQAEESSIEIVEQDVTDDGVAAMSDDIVGGDSGAFRTYSSTYPISIDGYSDDWDDKAYSYEYNWDNSSNCWQWGVWIDGVCYKTEPGTYDTNVRHKISVYCDGTNVYLHIVFSRDYGAKFNGENYEFSLDGKNTRFQITWNNGQVITNNLGGVSAGRYPVEVRHGDGSISWSIAEGSAGYLTVKDNNVNDELEIAIPLSEFKRQNSSIDIDNLSTIEYQCSNLTYRKITCTGTPTGPTIFIFSMLGIITAGTGFYYSRKRKRKTV